MARRVALAALSLLLLLALAIPGAQAQTPKRGGVLRIAEREAPGLDPHLSISFLTHSYVSLAYSQLVRFPNGPEQKHPADFAILPDLAEKWTVSKDGKVYTFSLRKGVHFHNKPPVNGRELVADDVKYSLERFMAKSGFKERFEPVQAIDVVDKHTVRIALKEPFAPFLNHLANPSFCAILPREAEDKFKDFNHPDAVIGTGPFVLKSYDKGVRGARGVRCRRSGREQSQSAGALGGGGTARRGGGAGTAARGLVAAWRAGRPGGGAHPLRGSLDPLRLGGSRSARLIIPFPPGR